MRLDVHRHYWPPRFWEKMAELRAFERLDAYAYYGARIASAAQRQFAGGEADAVARWIEEMDACEVDLTVVGLGGVQPYFHETADAVEAARFTNEILLDAVAMGAGRVAAFASLPLPHVDATLDAIASCLDERAFVGVSVGCFPDGRPLDDPMLEEVWSALNARAAVVHVHPAATGSAFPGTDDFGLAPMFLGPTEIAYALARLILAGVTRRHPRVTLVGAVHGGSIASFARRFDDYLRDVRPDMHRELGGFVPHLRRFWYDSSFDDPVAVEACRLTFGIDRLVLGSDAPRYSLRAAVDRLEAASYLSSEEKRRILDSNGVEIIGAARP